MDKKLLSIEHKLVSQALLNSDDKYFVEPYQLYLNLIWLNAEVGTGGGDVAGGADFAPTDTQLELLKTFENQMTDVDTEFRNFVGRRYAGFQSRSRRQRFPLSHCGIGFNRSAGCAFWIDVCFSL